MFKISLKNKSGVETMANLLTERKVTEIQNI